MDRILSYVLYQQTRARSTDRDEEAARAVRAEKVLAGKEFEPGIVAVEDEIAAFGADLGEPAILVRERGGSIALCEVQDKV